MSNWTEWSAVAEFTAAVALIISAGYLRSSARQTKALATKTETLATKTDTLGEHTRTLADETEKLGQHAQLDREMRYRPYVVPTLTRQHDESVSPATTWYEVVLRNAGEGPALDCSVGFIGDRGGFGSERSLILDPRETWTQTFLPSELVESGRPDGLFSPPAGQSMPGGSQYIVLVCTDVLGIRWRFLDSLPSESWRPASDEGAPPWTKW